MVRRQDSTLLGRRRIIFRHRAWVCTKGIQTRGREDGRRLRSTILFSILQLTVGMRSCTELPLATFSRRILFNDGTRNERRSYLIL